MKSEVAPIYIDSTSLLNDNQIKKLNSMIKTQINMFTSKAVQKQLPEDSKHIIVSSTAGMVSSIVGYSFDDNFFITIFIKTTNTGKYKIIKTTKNIKTLHYNGYYDYSMLYPFERYGSISANENVISIDINGIPTIDGKTALINMWGKYGD